MTLGLDERSELTLAVANSIRNIARFAAQEAADANDDFFFTLRMAQGQLYQLRRDTPSVYADEVVGELLRAAEADLSSAEVIMQENFQSSVDLGPDYNFIMDPARGKTMVRIDPTVTISNFGKAWLAASQKNLDEVGFIMPFNEWTSDRCLGQLRPQNLTDLEIAVTGRSSSCSVDDSCWMMMIKPGATGYYVTHQVMFLALGGTTGCGPDFETHAQRYFANFLPSNVGPITPEILRNQCRIVLLEANLYVALNIPDEEKDLFLEEGFLCGASVYMPGFFKPSWIRAILSWQKPSGCFGFFDNIEYPETEERMAGRSKEVIAGDSQVAVDDANDVNDVENIRPSPRREKPMIGNCYSHNTGVALGYLSVALRYLTD
ncbi:Protein of unknown function DUF4735 [Trinorchestia longiramus]|nr:Protein of unknown function DUF4735 [Trinorchestia longiramus]